MKENEKALNHVKALIESLNDYLPTSVKVEETAYVSFTYVFKVSIDDRFHRIHFERSIIDDLEVALEKYKGTNYFYTLESSIKFTIYISMGSEGLLENFNISRELINDKREWIKNYQVNLEFSEEMTELLCSGLKKIRDFFTSQLEKHKSLRLETVELEENKRWVDSLINYHDTHHHLNSPGVGTKNLQYLKAAAIQEIMDLEQLRSREKMPTTWRALNKKVYDIVIELRRDPFLEIELPGFMHDIAAASR